MKAEIHGSLDQLSFQSSLNWKNNGSRGWRECSWGSFFLFEMLMMVFHLSCFMFHVVKGFTPFLLISLYLYLAVCGPVYTILGKNSWLSIAVDKTTGKKIGFLESTRTNLNITWKWSGNITTWRSRQPEGGINTAMLCLCCVCMLPLLCSGLLEFCRPHSKILKINITTENNNRWVLETCE